MAAREHHGHLQVTSGLQGWGHPALLRSLAWSVPWVTGQWWHCSWWPFGHPEVLFPEGGSGLSQITPATDEQQPRGLSQWGLGAVSQLWV